MPKSNQIKNITAIEILDSRGIPTLSVKVELENRIKASAQVPSGTSSGKFEAFELRDGDKKRYGGKGVLKAVKNVKKIIASRLKGVNALNQGLIDFIMTDKLDRTKNKSRLGANAILGVSKACSRAAAYSQRAPLYKYLREFYNDKGRLKIHKLKELVGYKFPQPMFNFLNGGAHAESGMNIQEFMFYIDPIS